MSVLVKSLGDFIKLLFQVFNLSVVFPAIIFVFLVQAFISPHMPPGSLLSQEWDNPLQIGFTFIVVSLIAYFLDAANYPIIRTLEGYDLLFFRLPSTIRSFWQTPTKEFVLQIRNDITDLDAHIERLAVEVPRADPATATRLAKLMRELLDQKTKLRRSVAGNFPHDSNYILPTAFGNVISAAEEYPKMAFGIDAVALWPYLVPIITEKNFSQFVARYKAVMDFLINLMVIFGIFIPLFLISEWVYQKEFNTRAIVLVTILFLAIPILYLMAVQAAKTWGGYVRTAFVLYRNDLRTSLTLRKAYDFADERLLWKTTSDFLRADSGSLYIEQWGKEIFDTSLYATRLDRRQGKEPLSDSLHYDWP